MKTEADFDFYDKAVEDRAPEAWSELGRKHPIYHYRGRFDFYVSSDYDDIKNNILVDNDTWLYSRGTSPKELDPRMACGMMTEPPHHNGIRIIVQRGFTPKQLERIAVEIDQLADELIDGMQAMPEKRGNFFKLFAMPLPARLMCRMLGAPEEKHLQYKQWADEFMYDHYNNKTDSAEAGEKAQLIAASLSGLIAERRRVLQEAGVTEPSLQEVGTVLPDDFISRFICDKVDGRHLTEWEIISLLLSIINGGNETTMNLISNLLWRLLEKPERWEQLKANPDLIPNAVEESLRFDPPLLGMFRTTAKETELKGEVIPEGEKVMYSIAAANRDPAIWENPDEFRLDRDMATLRKHVSFSGGSHLCLGIHLARMEVRQVFEKLVERLPNLRLTGEPVIVPGFSFWGLVDLPVAWD
jgi:cytochrome P450